VLVNNAGMNRRAPIVDATLDDFDTIVATNLRSAFLLGQAAHGVMRDAGGGAIVNVGSITDRYGLGSVAVYGMTKAALAQLTRTMAVEWAADGIRVNGLSPGFIVTPLTESSVWGVPHRRDWLLARIPAGRPGAADDLAATLLLLASPASPYLTGEVIHVDGGFLAGGGWDAPSGETTTMAEPLAPPACVAPASDGGREPSGPARAAQGRGLRPPQGHDRARRVRAGPLPLRAAPRRAAGHEQDAHPIGGRAPRERGPAARLAAAGHRGGRGLVRRDHRPVRDPHGARELRRDAAGGDADAGAGAEADDQPRCPARRRAGGDVVENMRLDTDFHFLLCEFQGNREITRVMWRMRDRLARIIVGVLRQRPQRMLESVQEHRAVVEAIVAGDGQGAAAAMKAHLAWGQRFLTSR
jgi:hypothetical protein